MQLIERVAEHYDTQEMQFGRLYRWCPECVVVECKCGKRKTLSRSDLIEAKSVCKCGKDSAANIREEVIEELEDEDYEVHHHPWRYWHPTEDSGIPFDAHTRQALSFPREDLF